MREGLEKAIEVLGDKIGVLERTERYAREDAERTKKECDRYLGDVCRLNEEISDLKKQLSAANEKIREYENAVIIDNDGNLVQFKDLPEIEITSELEKEIQESLDRGKAPESIEKGNR